MTGDQFLEALKSAIAPATIESMKNNTADRNGGIDFLLSDGRRFNAKRQRIRDANEDEMNAYVQSLVS
ncbi:MAG: hypothetical protein JWM16_6335 [Verrucomicrobiales bacterium]|nr:hypothetical protein [Verrucomicrobiales bacterium]